MRYSLYIGLFVVAIAGCEQPTPTDATLEQSVLMLKNDSLLQYTDLSERFKKLETRLKGLEPKADEHSVMVSPETDARLKAQLEQLEQLRDRVQQLEDARQVAAVPADPNRCACCDQCTGKPDCKCGCPKCECGVVDWMYDAEAAWAKAAELHRPRLIVFVTENCPACQAVEANVFAYKKVMARVKREYIPVWQFVPRKQWKAIEASDGVTSYPSVKICDEDGCRIPFEPAQTADGFLAQLDGKVTPPPAVTFEKNSQKNSQTPPAADTKPLRALFGGRR